jgi:hypothetical protein
MVFAGAAACAASPEMNAEAAIIAAKTNFFISDHSLCSDHLEGVRSLFYLYADENYRLSTRCRTKLSGAFLPFGRPPL